MSKPKVGGIYCMDFPEDEFNERLLKGPHPGVVTRNNNDDTSEVIGCTSNPNNRRGSIPIKGIPEDNLNPNTRALVSQGERNFHNSEFEGKEWNYGTEIDPEDLKRILGIL